MPEMKTFEANGVSYDIRDAEAARASRTINGKPLTNDITLGCNDVGAAPGGFGLGTYAQWINDCNDAILNGWYATSDAVNVPASNGATHAYGWLFVSVRTAAAIKQDYYTCTVTPLHFERYHIDNVWSEWKDVSASAFAPSGYGWGEKHAPDAPNLDPDYIDTTCVFIANAGGSPADGVWLGSFLAQAGGENGSMVMEALNGSCVGCKVIRQKLNGVWQPWEWVNPPMVPGEEYRTTERYNGKPVYTSLVVFGSMPNTASAYVNHGISGITQVIRCVGQNITNGESLPSQYNSNFSEIFANDTYVFIHTSFNASEYLANAQLWYTKD